MLNVYAGETQPYATENTTMLSEAVILLFMYLAGTVHMKKHCFQMHVLARRWLFMWTDGKSQP